MEDSPAQALIFFSLASLHTLPRQCLWEELCSEVQHREGWGEGQTGKSLVETMREGESYWVLLNGHEQPLFDQKNLRDIIKLLPPGYYQTTWLVFPLPVVYVLKSLSGLHFHLSIPVTTWDENHAWQDMYWGSDLTVQQDNGEASRKRADWRPSGGSLQEDWQCRGHGPSFALVQGSLGRLWDIHSKARHFWCIP